MKMMLECVDEEAVDDSLSGSSNDSSIVSKQNTKAFIWNTVDLNQTKQEICDEKTIQNAAFADSKLL